MCGASARRSTPAEASNDARSAHDTSLLRLLLIAAFLAVWEAIVRLFEIPRVHPAGADQHRRWRCSAASTSSLYLDHICVTLTETLLGFVLGSSLAFALGTAVALSRRVEYFLYPFIVMFQAMPKVALAPLIIIWFGLGLTSKVVNAGAGRFLSADGQHHRRAALGRRGPRQPDALARGLARPDLLDAAAAERACPTSSRVSRSR